MNLQQMEKARLRRTERLAQIKEEIIEHCRELFSHHKRLESQERYRREEEIRSLISEKDMLEPLNS